MDLNGSNQSFFDRFYQQIKEVSVILLMLLILLFYQLLPAFRSLLDRPVDFAVAGISMGYGHLSTWVYQHTGYDTGMAVAPPDPDFLFRVRLAAAVNERRAGPLLDIAVDPRLPVSQREEALLSLLKFDSIAQWIQPFLNEMAKGGLPGIYEDDSPAMRQLIQQIRLEGGIRQTLVRAYADSVLSFMMQHPKPILRIHAYQWVNDLMAEDAIPLLAERIDKEEDPQARAALTKALWNVRAVVDQASVQKKLLPFYHQPPWPEIHPAIAYVLARSGFLKARDALSVAMRDEKLDSDLRSLASLALSGRQFPQSLSISGEWQKVLAERQRRRDDQEKWAMGKVLREQQAEAARLAAIQEAERAQEEAARQQQLAEQREVDRKAKLAELARRQEEAKLERQKRHEEARLARAKRDEEARLAREKREEQARLARKKEEEEAKRLQKKKDEYDALMAKEKADEDARLLKEKQLEEIRLAKEKKAEEERLAQEKKEEEELEKKWANAEAVEEATPVPAATPSKQLIAAGTRTQSAPTQLPEAPGTKGLTNAVALNKQTPMPEMPDFDPNAAARTAKDSARTSAKTPNMIDQLQPEGSASHGPSLKPLGVVEGKISGSPGTTQVASIPTEQDIQKELARRRAKKASGPMVSVNSLFEVRNQDVPLYSDPGYNKPTGIMLPIGSKGTATFKVTLGDDEWYQVKSKKDSGWANGSLLTLYEMQAVAETPTPPPVAPSKVDGKKGPGKALPKPVAAAAAIQDSTYFEPTMQGVPVFKEADGQSTQVATLEEGVAYLGKQTQKVGAERWFLVEVNSQISGWARGTDIQLASMILPPPDETPESLAKDKTVSTTEDGVPVYNRPTITSKKIKSLTKNELYKVLDADEDTGNEWLRIELPNKKQGWVQAMFVTVKGPGVRK